MKKLYFVDLEMCGGENLPADFNLEDFCEVLQGKVSDIEIVPVHESNQGRNTDRNVLPAHAFVEALGEYCGRCV
jgi:hypothetical protein